MASQLKIFMPVGIAMSMIDAAQKVFAILRERANTLLWICYPRSPVTVYHPLTVVKYFNGNFPRISSAHGTPGASGRPVLTSVSNASKLVPLSGVVVPLPRAKHRGVTGG